MLFQVLLNGMRLLLYYNIPLKSIVLLLSMVYCILTNLLSCRCQVINIILSDVVIIHGQVSLPAIALILTDLAVFPSSRICKNGSQLPPNCSSISQVWFNKRSVCFESFNSNHCTFNKKQRPCNHLLFNSIGTVQWILCFGCRYKLLHHHIWLRCASNSTYCAYILLYTL